MTEIGTPGMALINVKIWQLINPLQITNNKWYEENKDGSISCPDCDKEDNS